MPETRLTRRNGRRIQRLAVLAVAVAATVLMAPGCCKYDEEGCTTATEREVTHTAAIAENMVSCGGPAVTCVCPVPTKVTVRAGDKILFVNTTDYDATVHPSMDGAFTVPGDINIAAKESVTRTIVDPLPDALGSGIGTTLNVSAPGTVCGGALPGPGVDFDDD